MITLTHSKKITKRHVKPKVLYDDDSSISVGTSTSCGLSDGLYHIDLTLSNDDDYYRLRLSPAEARLIIDRLTNRLKSVRHYVETGEWL